MKYVITGAAGYIGRNILNRLALHDDEITALIHSQEPKIFHPTIQYVQGDISQPSFLESLPKDVDIVIHCAAMVKDYGWKKDFMNVNYRGTKYIVDHYQNSSIKQFIFLSHINYNKSSSFNYYAQTKKLAEEYLFHKWRTKQFPITIIRPGNVFGPDATIWVNNIIEAIRSNQFALIDDGQATFFHTYIDNLIDAIILSIGNKKVIGEAINITDDDYQITWKKYFSDLSQIMNMPIPQRNISKKMAYLLAYLFMLRFFVSQKKPWITPAAVQLLTAQKEISLEKSKRLLNYTPFVDYGSAIEKIKSWWNSKTSSSKEQN